MEMEVKILTALALFFCAFLMRNDHKNELMGNEEHKSSKDSYEST